jgi:Putative papain-like cysteine peptidase (DUF1796)
MYKISHEIPSVHIDLSKYDAIISIGNKCPTAMTLRKLNIYKEAYPFDCIPTTPKLILKYLKNQEDFFPSKNVVSTADGVWFGHYNIDEKYEETIETLKRRFTRLLNALEEKKKILFVYTSEADFYNEMGNRYNDNYAELLNIQEYIKNKYKYDNFSILAIHTNKQYSNTEGIFNFTMHVDDGLCSDNGETHHLEICIVYRDILKSLLAHIFGVPNN